MDIQILGLGPVVQSIKSIISLTSLLMTMQKLHTFFSAKNINVFAILQDRNFNVTLANNFIKF